MIDVQDIQELSNWCWAQLSRATKDRHSEFRWVNLGTVDPDGFPQVRTVVLREAVQSENRVTFHTDRRSKKVVELTERQSVTLHFHSRRHSVQLRLAGIAELASEQGREIAWQALHDGAKATYTQDLPPGSVIDSDMSDLTNARSSSNNGFSNFVAIDVRISTIDWLELDRSGHRRALLSYEPDGAHKATWLAP